MYAERIPGGTRAIRGAHSAQGDVFERLDALQFGELHLCNDRDSGLRALIAIHDTRRGPALGGCRCLPYPDTDAALTDALRLARGMSYKAALAGLPYGGGKAVLLRPARIPDREAYFEAFGRCVEQLGGRYISAVDCGTTPAEMDLIARRTAHVTCTSPALGGSGDASPHTALGVRRGIEAALRVCYGSDNLDGLTVAIQGTGQVGYYLARELAERGARLIACDTNPKALARVCDEFGAQPVAVEAIYDQPCDVFAPCALGGVLDDDSIPRLRASIVAGSANNQLAEARHGVLLAARGICYVPDYVVNAGGLIHVGLHHLGREPTSILEKITGLYDTIVGLLDTARSTGRPSSEVADGLAEQILYGQALRH